ncbi:ribonuclease R [Spongorhabdus nitratireducens]
MSQWWKNADPQAAAEANKYDSPIPSRELIMEQLETRRGPVKYHELCAIFELTTEEELEALRRRMIAMVRDGQLLETRRGAYGLLSKMDLVTGKVQGHRDGYGFVIPKDGSDDLFISAREMRQVFDGDVVVVRETRVDRKGKREGSIVDVLERNTSQLVGRYFEEGDSSFVMPDNKRVSREVLLKPGPLQPRPGQFALVEILEQPSRSRPPIGLVKEILGNRTDPGMEIDVALRTHEIPHVWPESVEKEVRRFTAEVAEKDKGHRIDLRHVPFVTIDGEDARDFDDAVYCETKKSGGWRLFVAIADVSHYVAVGSALDEEAQNRGTSVYFPGHVVPMLPEILSNGLCSLNPEVDRLAMVCEMTISANGRLSGYRFYEGLINSHARLTYTKVWDMLDQPESDKGKQLREQYASVVSHVDELYNLFHALKQQRKKRGAIDFETTETQIIFNDQRKIEKIVPTERNDAHKLIEECMLCANVSAARFLEKHGLPGLYRVHEGPNLEKRLNLNSFLGELGLSLPGGNLKTGDFQNLLESIKDRPDFHLIQVMMLRSMSQAVYTPENQGHFGLAFTGYAHFTSPIRRYPDLLVHRAIRHIIRSERETDKVRRVEGTKLIPAHRIYPYDTTAMMALGEQCSQTERRADEATRDAMDWLKCEYMQQHLGDEFEGVVSAVTGFGLFVELKDVYVEGLIHISCLPGDYYHYDASRQRLVGEKTGMSYHLGDELSIIVARVNMNDKKVDFELSGAPSPRRRRKNRDVPKNMVGQTDRRKKGKTKKELLEEAARAVQAAGDSSGKGSGKGSGKRTGEKPGDFPSVARKPGSKRRKSRTRGKKKQQAAQSAQGTNSSAEKSGPAKNTKKKTKSKAAKRTSRASAKPTGKQPRKRPVKKS